MTPLSHKIINLLGGTLENLHLARIQYSADALIEKAQTHTQLSALGTPHFRQALEVLIDELNGKTDLTYIGKKIAEQSLIQFLSRRLRICHDLEQHPEINDIPITRPIIITGLPRTGTTFLHNLMTTDPATRWIQPWELEESNTTTAARIQQTEATNAKLKQLYPELDSMHAFDSPVECSLLFLPTFLTDYFYVSFGLARYKTWTEELSSPLWQDAYQFYKNQLQRLQWKDNPQSEANPQWVLKSPHHLQNLEVLLQTFPDACVIQLHRNPKDVLLSSIRYYSTIHGMHCKKVELSVHANNTLKDLAKLTNDGMLARERLPKENFLDIGYHDLIQDPLATQEKIHQHFNLSPPAMDTDDQKSWLDTHHWNRKTKSTSSKPRLKDLGLTDVQVMAAFERYLEHHDDQLSQHNEPSLNSETLVK